MTVARDVERTELVGRDDEIARLRSLVRRLTTGRGGSVLVEGEPGIGKTSLLAAGLAEATDLGCLVFHDLSELPSLTLQRHRLPDVVERLCASAPVVLVQDDLQWADETTLHAWCSFSQTAGRLPLLLAAACRPEPRRAELARLRRAGSNNVVLRLHPLPEEQVADLVGRLVGGVPPPGLLHLADLAGGNPQYLRDIVDALKRDGVADVSSLADDPTVGPLPSSLARVITDRLGFLSEEANELLRMAALLGFEFSGAELRKVTDLPAATVGAGMEEAWAARVLTRPTGKTRFRHPVVQRALYEATPASLRSALHRHFAQTLASTSAPDHRVAEQLLAAPDAVDGWVRDWLARTGERLAREAPALSATLLERALDHMPADDPRREQTETCLAAALRLLARYDDLERLARRALARPGRAEHAAWMTWLQALALTLARPEDGLNLVAGPMLGQPFDERWTARLVALRALMLGLVGRPAEAEATAAETLAVARRIGDEPAAGYATYAMAVAASHGDGSLALELAGQALTAAGDHPDTVELRLALLADRAFAFDQLGMRAEADAAVRVAHELAARVSTTKLAAVQVLAAVHSFETGRWDEALSELDLIDEVPEPGPLAVSRDGIAALIAVHRDDRAALRRHLNRATDATVSTDVMWEYGHYLVRARALAAERDGRPRQALATLTPALERHPRLDAVRAAHYGVPDLVRLALGVDEHGVARAAVAAMEAGGDRELPKHAAAAHRCRGLLEWDPTLLIEAAAYYRSADEPLALAGTLEDAAVVYGQHGDLAAGKEAFAESVETYERLGAVWDIRRAESRVRPYGMGRGQRGPRRRPTAGLDALTPTEVRVARLVARGLSNPEIARELFLSRRTVQSHVSHILGKLDVRSRHEVADVLAGQPWGADEEAGVSG